MQARRQATFTAALGEAHTCRQRWLDGSCSIYPAVTSLPGHYVGGGAPRLTCTEAKTHAVGRKGRRPATPACCSLSKASITCATHTALQYHHLLACLGQLQSAREASDAGACTATLIRVPPLGKRGGGIITLAHQRCRHPRPGRSSREGTCVPKLSVKATAAAPQRRRSAQSDRTSV